MMAKLRLVVHNVRSAHNVGSILRTADGLGVEHVYLSGYSPYPETNNDERLPHVAKRATEQIQKTALGAETSMAWSHEADISQVLESLKVAGWHICALEQANNSIMLDKYQPAGKEVLVLGSEVKGVDQTLLKLADTVLEIPMRGRKESFNVAVAAAIASYELLN